MRIRLPALTRRSLLRLVRGLMVTGLAVAVLVQLVPYGRAHSLPPVSAEPQWDSPATRDLAVRACFDCHSNEVTWPWYSNVAPISWLVQRDVGKGRDELNFSEWLRPNSEAGGAAKAVRDGEMPPSIYVLTHRNARLNSEEQAQLIRGLVATFGDEKRGDDREDERDEEDEPEEDDD